MTGEQKAERVRACDWCGKSAPEGDALLSIWWADYECCSMECTTLANAEVLVPPGQVSHD